MCDWSTVSYIYIFDVAVREEIVTENSSVFKNGCTYYDQAKLSSKTVFAECYNDIFYYNHIIRLCSEKVPAEAIGHRGGCQTHVGGSTTSSTTSSTKTTGSGDLTVPSVGHIVGGIPPVQPQPKLRRPVGSGSGGNSVLQVDVKGKVCYKSNILFFCIFSIKRKVINYKTR